MPAENGGVLHKERREYERREIGVYTTVLQYVLGL